MARRRKGDPVHGWVIIDKPSGPTSTQAIGRVRRVFRPQKIGHGGTLDPLATGLLPVAMGEATKTIPYVMDSDKRYRFTLRWGEATATDDAEGAVIERSDHRPGLAEIDALLPRFTGWVDQVPPLYSAIKVEGQRAYDLARAAEDFSLASRRVWIGELRRLAPAELPGAGLDLAPETMMSPDHASFEVLCGKGTYMRSLARDLGRALGTCAHIAALRRVSVGPFSEADAISLESLEALGHSPAAFEHLLPVETALDDIPALALSEAEAVRLRNGQAVSMLARSNRDRISQLDNGDVICAMSGGKLVALARYDAGDIRPLRVLNL